MEKAMEQLIGAGTDLSTGQMTMRGLLVFVAAFIMIKVSGRRSFGLKMPFDNIITILLGAILSRAVTGASPFIPTLICSLALVIFHRLLGWSVSRSSRLSKLLEGREITLFNNGRFDHDNMKKALVCEADIYQGVRKALQTEDLGTVKKVYMEKNGDIYAVRKEQA